MLQRIVFLRGLRLLRTGLTAALLGGMALPGMAIAQPGDYCRQLEAQFAALGAGSRTDPQQIARYDTAIAAQQGELRKAEDQVRRAGCDVARGAVCAGLDATVQRMRQNLADLQHTRQRFGSSAGLQAERTRLSAQMSAEGCAAAARTETQAASTVTISGQPASRANMSQAAAAETGARYRTMCVRMCDGFFFPISHSTPRSLFERDEKLCAARCPGTEVQLHFHRFPGQESDDMVSVPTGISYREGENAFRYRQASWERPANCGCAAERGYEVLAGGEGWTNFGAAEADPEAGDAHMASASTLRSGSFLIQEERAAGPAPSAEPAALSDDEPPVDETTTAAQRPVQDAPADRPVRVVGPTFLPAPEEAIDLQSQDPYRAR